MLGSSATVIVCTFLSFMAASDGIKQRKIVQEVSENPFNQLSLRNSIRTIVLIAHPFLLSVI